MGKLTAAKVKSISKPGRYRDGGTLFVIADNKVAFDRATKKGLKGPLINFAFGEIIACVDLCALFSGGKARFPACFRRFLSVSHDPDGPLPTSTSGHDAPDKHWPAQTT